MREGRNPWLTCLEGFQEEALDRSHEKQPGTGYPIPGRTLVLGSAPDEGSKHHALAQAVPTSRSARLMSPSLQVQDWHSERLPPSAAQPAGQVQGQGGAELHLTQPRAPAVPHGPPRVSTSEERGCFAPDDAIFLYEQPVPNAGEGTVFPPTRGQRLPPRTGNVTEPRGDSRKPAHAEQVSDQAAFPGY